jgi:hypothetical protein
MSLCFNNGFSRERHHCICFLKEPQDLRHYTRGSRARVETTYHRLIASFEITSREWLAYFSTCIKKEHMSTRAMSKERKAHVGFVSTTRYCNRKEAAYATIKRHQRKWMSKTKIVSRISFGRIPCMRLQKLRRGHVADFQAVGTDAQPPTETFCRLILSGPSTFPLDPSFSSSNVSRPSLYFYYSYSTPSQATLTTSATAS